MMEFQAVVMAAGAGSRMRELTSSTPKCLLPVGNIPLIVCSLSILKRAGINEAILLVKEKEKSKIQNAIENRLGMKLDIVAIPEKNDDWGTADSLRYIKDKIKSHVIVLSCDIVSDMDIRNLINLHRSRGSSLTVLLVPFPKTLKDADVPGSKKKCKFERDIVGLDSQGKLLFINSDADFEEIVPFRMSILDHHRSDANVHSNLMDAHIYIIKKDFVNFLVNGSHISTLKGEFLPAAVKKQFSTKPQDGQNDSSEGTLPSHGIDENWIDLKKLAFDLSSFKVHLKPAVEDRIHCNSFIDTDCFCTRVNTVVAYADINRKVLKQFNVLTGETNKPHNFLKSQVDSESAVGDGCELQVKASLKQSAVGFNCKLGEKTKITNSIVMDNVSFGKECVVQGSIICSNVTIEDNCSLKNCIIGPDQTIEALTKLNSENLQGSDHLMQI